jgi:REP element-mobilizing transposase RayT
LASDRTHDLLRQTWSNATFWQVGRYVIMPDHVHFFCAPVDPECALEKWMQYWKSKITKAWPIATQKPVFQRDHWDRELRSTESYDEKWDYVRKTLFALVSSIVLTPGPIKAFCTNSAGSGGTRSRAFPL